MSLSVLIRLGDGRECIDELEISRRWKQPVWYVRWIADMGLLVEADEGLRGYFQLESVEALERQGLVERR